ncbi:hypothetical protein [Bacillus sp. 179-C3.3 HS]|uniref:hypothetical protein n=1 Tax=Bacillus sp. 179-C3.3 HS TaxID=3232162 RepID=UPI0039A0EED4
MFPSDYEGYELYVALVDDEKKFTKLTTPYVEQYAQEDDAIEPIEIIKEYESKRKASK